MPNEFWREVVDRLSTDAPDTSTLSRSILVNGIIFRQDTRNASRLQFSFYAYVAK